MRINEQRARSADENDAQLRYRNTVAQSKQNWLTNKSEDFYNKLLFNRFQFAPSFGTDATQRDDAGMLIC